MRQLTIFIFVMGVTLSTNVAAENPVVNHAVEAGVKKCLPAVKYVSNYLIGDRYVGAFSSWNPDSPNMQMFTSIIEQDYGSLTTLTNMTVSPVASGQCAAVYNQIAYWQKSCISISKEIFGEYEYMGTVNNNVALLKNGANQNVAIYLLPAGDNGCVSVKKEILMDATP